MCRGKDNIELSTEDIPFQIYFHITEISSLQIDIYMTSSNAKFHIKNDMIMRYFPPHHNNIVPIQYNGLVQFMFLAKDNHLKVEDHLGNQLIPNNSIALLNVTELRLYGGDVFLNCTKGKTTYSGLQFYSENKLKLVF